MLHPGSRSSPGLAEPCTQGELFPIWTLLHLSCPPATTLLVGATQAPVRKGGLDSWTGACLAPASKCMVLVSCQCSRSSSEVYRVWACCLHQKSSNKKGEGVVLSGATIHTFHHSYSSSMSHMILAAHPPPRACGEPPPCSWPSLSSISAASASSSSSSNARRRSSTRAFLSSSFAISPSMSLRTVWDGD